MKNIEEIISAVDLSNPKETIYPRQIIDKESAKIINYIFKRLLGFIPAMRYSARCQITLDLIKREWTYALVDEKISRMEDIERGLNKLRAKGRIYLPPVGEFIKLCKLSPEDMELPSIYAAYKEACMNSHPTSHKMWSHQAIYHAWSMMDSFALSNQHQQETFPLFEYYYLETVRQIIAGNPLKEIPKALPEPGRIVIKTKQVGIDAIRSLKTTLGIRVME